MTETKENPTPTVTSSQSHHPEDQTNTTATPIIPAFDPRAFLELRVWSNTFYQVQRDRISLSNRLRSDAVPPDVVAELTANYLNAETMVKKAMRHSFRRAAPEVVAWIKTDAAVGIGEHLMARLLGTIGHPVIAQPFHWEGEGSARTLIADPPFQRRVSDLWSYCGVGDPTRKRFRNMSAEEAMALGNPQAKMLVRLLAESCIKSVGSANTLASPKDAPPTDSSSAGETRENALTNKPTSSGSTQSVSSAGEPTLPKTMPPTDSAASDDVEPGTAGSTRRRRRSPYRDIYDEARERYDAYVDWTPLHSHNASLRLVGKVILKDLWRLTHDTAQEGENG